MQYVAPSVRFLDADLSVYSLSNQSSSALVQRSSVLPNNSAIYLSDVLSEE
jgi:hypothetical protein